jgi:MFS family permease
VRPDRDRTPLVLIELATLLSATGNGVALIALPWIALELTGRATSASVVATATALPLVLSSLVSGTVVDTLGRRPTAAGADALSAASVAAIPVLAATAGLSVTGLAVLAGVGAVFDPAGLTARSALLPEAADRAGFDLERVNAVTEAVWGVAFLVGPGLGGVLIAALGATSTLWVTAGAFTVAVVASLAVHLPGADRPAPGERPTDLVRSTIEGLAFVWRDPLLRDVSLFGTVLVAVYLPIEAVLLPAWFEQQGRPEQLGGVLMAFAVGGIVGALAYARWGRAGRRRAIFVVGTVGACIALVVIGRLPPLPIMLGAGVVTGLCYGPVDPLRTLTAQRRADDRLRGRVLGVLAATEYAAGPIGYLLVGPAVDRFGIESTFAAVTVALLVVAVGAVGLRSLHELETL